jgi:hypothetical protein
MFSGLPPKRMHPRTLASLQPRSRVALGRSCSCDRALAIELHEFGLCLRAGPSGVEQIVEALAQLVTLGADMIEFMAHGRERPLQFRAASAPVGKLRHRTAVSLNCMPERSARSLPNALTIYIMSPIMMPPALQLKSPFDRPVRCPAGRAYLRSSASDDRRYLPTRFSHGRAYYRVARAHW